MAVCHHSLHQNPSQHGVSRKPLPNNESFLNNEPIRYIIFRCTSSLTPPPQTFCSSWRSFLILLQTCQLLSSKINSPPSLYVHFSLWCSNLTPCRKLFLETVAQRQSSAVQISWRQLFQI